MDKNLFVVSQAEDIIDYSNDARFKEAGRVSSEQLEILSSIALDGATVNTLRHAFIVHYPEGVAGTLVKHGDGYLSLIRGENGIVGHATYVPIGETPVVVYSLFKGLSVITSQYYLHQLNKQITDIKAKLDSVLSFLYDDKACELYAQAKAISNAYENYGSIMAHPELQSATLYTIQQAKITGEKNIQFYSRDMGRIVDLPATKIDSSAVHSLRDDLDNYTQAINLYGICSIMEIMFSQNFDKSFLGHVEKELSEHITEHTKIMARLSGMLDRMRSEKAGPLAKIDQGRIGQMRSEVQKLLSDKSPVQDARPMLQSIRQMYTENTELRILKDGRVYRKISS